MRTKLIALSVPILLMGMSSVHAANQANVEFLGNIQAVSCDVNVNGQNQVTLGSVRTTDFTAASTPVSAGQTDFQLTLSGCDKLAAAGKAQVEISGDTVPGTNNIFLQKSKNPTSNAGVMILDKNKQPIQNGNAVEMANITAPDQGEDYTSLDNTSLKLTAAYGSTATDKDVTTGTFKAPVLFSFIYE
ncbi:MAG: fimbrial protein [Pseudomonadota bacterium]|uniref:fimbrial protein n=1 Tax=Providencia TaxID=586 RepID=UPI0024B260BF